MTYFSNGRFLVWCPGEGQTEDDATRIDVELSVMVAHNAAKRWLQGRNDEAHYTDSGELTIAHVRDPGGVVTRWKVSAELTTTYTAMEAT